MKRFLPVLGVCVLLLAVQIECSKNNKKSFWDLWSKATDNAAPAAGTNDITLDTEGSGDEDIDSNKVGHTHADDEDFDMSGDDEDFKQTTIIPETDKDSDMFIDKDDNKDTDKHDHTKHDHKGPTDDEDDYLEGSASGDGIVDETIVPVSVKPVDATQKPLTACENLRTTALQVSASYLPECDLDGTFKKQQCTVDITNKEKNCWCVDPRGLEIMGTRMKHPKSPDCIFGENLSTCVFQLIQHSTGMLGSYKPKCTLEGEYESVQCQGSQCWCVDRLGNEITGTIINKPDMPKCPPMTASTPKTTPRTLGGKPATVGGKPATEKTKPLPKPNEPGYNITADGKDDIPNVIVNIGPEIPIDSEESDLEEKEEETNQVGESYATMRHNEPILAQPGLLAAIIGGAVVGLLCMVLLVMFVVYRMRKKDEGSYPLDEQKYQNYSYNKAPDKEFYA